MEDDTGVLSLQLEHVIQARDDALTTIAELRARVAELRGALEKIDNPLLELLSYAEDGRMPTQST